MSHVSLNWSDAHAFVENNSKARWDGWTIVLFEQDRPGRRSGQFSKFGARLNDKWGVQTRIDVDSDGNWKVPQRFVL